MLRRALILAPAALLLAPAAAVAGHGEGEEKKKGGGLQFIQIQTVAVNFVRRDGRMGVMTVESGIDVPDEKLRVLASQSQPRLRAAYNAFLSTYSPSLRGAVAPNADYIARELQRQTDIVLGRPGAKLLLGTILMN
jgi:hypothetical protein